MYQNFLGIDIGKNDFVVALHGSNEVQTFTNDQQGFDKFITEFKSGLTKALVIIETTGGYERAAIRALQQQGIDVHRANTRKVKSFIRSYGCLGKSDSIDAKALARYGSERHESLPLFEEDEHEYIRELISRRRELKRMVASEKTRRKAPGKKHLEFSFDAVITALNNEVSSLNKLINEACKKVEYFDEKVTVIKAVAGIGDCTAVELLASMPELGKRNRKQIASLAGMAPHPNESGQYIGYRRMRGGRDGIKPILFLAAMAASRSKSELGAFYHKLVDAGKNKMVALGALMRKILVIANAKLRDYLKEKTQEQWMAKEQVCAPAIA